MNTSYDLPLFRVELVREKSVSIETSEAIIRTVEDVQKVGATIAGKDREHLMVIWLNARHKMIGHEIVSIGTLTASLAHPREIFKGALIAGAAGIILVHNHPSGDPSPSDEDQRLTSRIAQGGRLLGIDLFEHLIVATDGCYSFKASGSL